MEAFLHHEIDLGEGDIVEVLLDHWANVMLMDDAAFGQYQRGEKFSYRGGKASPPTIQITAPHAGHWHLVIDLGGFAGSVQPYLRVLHHPVFSHG